MEKISHVLQRMADIQQRMYNVSKQFTSSQKKAVSVTSFQEQMKEKVSPSQASVSNELLDKTKLDKTDKPSHNVEKPYQNIIEKAANRYNLPEELLHAVIKQESGYKKDALSPKGAMGLMQLMPNTARYLDVNDPYEPNANIMGGTKYLREVLDKYNGDIIKGLAAYNAGPNALKNNKVPPYQETQKYIKNIMNNYLKNSGVK